MASHNRMTNEEISNVLSLQGCTLIERYFNKNKQTRVIFKDLDGYKFDLDYYSFKNQGRNFVDVSNPFSIENIELWIKNNNKNFILVGENKYLGKDIPNINVLCLVCNQEVLKSWVTISTRGCPYCSNNRVGIHRNLLTMFPSLVAELSEENDFLPEDVSPYSHRSAIWNCSQCGNTWKTNTIAERTKGGNGCPNCSSSRGEKKVSRILDGTYIEYTQEEKFDNCRNIFPLPFDFYLPNYNLCIEYHGEQHYEAREFFGGEDGLKQRQINDKIKENYCRDNGIGLLIIPYWEFDNIEQILIDTMQEIERSNYA